MTFQVIPMTPRTLSWWRDEREDIDLEPTYQRKGHIWSDTQKQYLIDSILNGFDIPKLYIADFTFFSSSKLNSVRKKYAVIDGKQRLLAIFDFFDDKITLPRGFVYRDDPELKLSGLSYSDLQRNHPKVSRKFDNSSLTVMSVITDDEAQINELFVRLNSSKPLTGAEVRSAMGGRIPTIINNLVAHHFFVSKIDFGTNRSQDKNTAAKLLLLEHRGTIVDTKKGQLDKLVSEAKELDIQSSHLPNDAGADVQESDGQTSEPHQERETSIGAIAVEVDEAIAEVAEDTESVDFESTAKRVVRVLDRLTEVFIDNDPLLKQSSQVVMIYWLARDLQDEDFAKLRPFLVRFEEERAANRKTSKDSTLTDYEIMARTSNDAYSIRRRDEILRERFSQFTLQP